MNASSHPRGFTLIEMVVALTVGALVIGFAAMMTVAPVNTYVDQAGRAEINDSVEIVTRRLDDDFRRALPNSVSIRNAGTRAIVEMLVVDEVVFYRNPSELGQATRELDFAVADTQFSVFGLLDRTNPALAALNNPKRLVASNMGRGMGAFDAYRTNLSPGAIVPANRNIQVNPLPGSEEAVSITNIPFRFSNPAQAGTLRPSNPPILRNRMFVVSGAVTYICNSAANTRSLRRYANYGIQPAIATAETTGFLNAGGVENTLLADNITSCRIRCGANAAVEPVCSDTLTIQLEFGRTSVSGGNERIRMHRQFPIDDDL